VRDLVVLVGGEQVAGEVRRGVPREGPEGGGGGLGVPGLGAPRLEELRAVEELRLLLAHQRLLATPARGGRGPLAARVVQRWVIAVEIKIQLPNTLLCILNCVIGFVNWSYWVKEANFQLLITKITQTKKCRYKPK